MEQEVEFSGGFVDLHTKSYQAILSGNGFGIEDNIAAVSLVEQLQSSAVKAPLQNHHPLLKLVN